MTVSKCTVIGAGSWGTTIARILATNVEKVVLWARDEEVIVGINSRHTNERFLPDVTLPENVSATGAYDVAFGASGLVVWAIPLQYTRARLMDCAGYLPAGSVVVNLSKGIENDTLCRPSQIIPKLCPQIAAFGTLGGPNVAIEIATGKPAEASLALESHWEQDGLERLFSTDSFKVRLTPDLVALELAGALKNVVALAAGLCDGLQMGENFKGAIVARGFNEMCVVGRALAANPEAFSSAFALGDLLATSYSRNSRNRTLGSYIATEGSLDKAISKLNGRVAEGVATAGSCLELGRRLNLNLPLVGKINEILGGRVSVESFRAELIALSHR